MTQSRSTAITSTAAAVLVIAVVVVCAQFWADLGGNGMSTAGWAAMLLGIVVTLALGIGLMSLVFLSNRRGYDDPYR